LKRCGNTKHSFWCVGVPQTRPLSCFSKNRGTPDGLHNECKDCTRFRDRRRLEQKLKKRGKTIRPLHCTLCGGQGHQSNHCKSPRTIPGTNVNSNLSFLTFLTVGKKHCNYLEHGNWFPTLHRVQPISSFYKDSPWCKSCSKKYDRRKYEQNAKKRGRTVGPPKIQRCALCGGQGHTAKTCKSLRTFPGTDVTSNLSFLTFNTEGKKKCYHSEHENWFRTLERLQPISSFYKGKSVCKSCLSKQYKKQYRKKRRKKK